LMHALITQQASVCSKELKACTTSSNTLNLPALGNRRLAVRGMRSSVARHTVQTDGAGSQHLWRCNCDPLLHISLCCRHQSWPPFRLFLTTIVNCTLQCMLIGMRVDTRLDTIRHFTALATFIERTTSSTNGRPRCKIYRCRPC